jgi:hypothetical protein
MRRGFANRTAAAAGAAALAFTPLMNPPAAIRGARRRWPDRRREQLQAVAARIARDEPTTSCRAVRRYLGCAARYLRSLNVIKATTSPFEEVDVTGSTTINVNLSVGP